MRIAKSVVVETRAWIPLAAMLFAALAGGCRTSSSRPPDSAHIAQLRQYLRDSSVLDSLSRLVKTDSLRALYRLALQPSGGSAELVQEAWCEEVRLSVMRGEVPAQKAIDRLLDTVYEDRGIRGHDDALAHFLSRAPDSRGVDGRACGKMPPRTPEIVAGTRVNESPSRPQMQ